MKPSDYRYHLGVPDGRPPIPQPLVRRILLEAGHRCAIPTCRAHPVEIAHIVPWSRAKEHAYENLIALCPTCHSRYDRGEIDRTSMLQYKERLRQLWDVERKEQSSERAMQIDAFCNLAATMRMWLDSIAALANAEVFEEAYEFIDPATRGAMPDCTRCREECAAAWRKAQEAMLRFRVASDDEFFRIAERAYDRARSWADHVVDGLWPSTHLGADQHEDVWDLTENLVEYGSERLGISFDDLWLHTGREWKEARTELGGTGKRF